MAKVTKTRKCPTCHGHGTCEDGSTCSTCDGKGEIPGAEPVIPVDEPCRV